MILAVATFSQKNEENKIEWISISELLIVATFKPPVATCDEWRQGWITML
jgi:hypothetical protein